MVPPPHISVSLPIKWGHTAGIDLSAAFWKCWRFFPVALSEWCSSPSLSSRFLPKLGSHNAYARVRKKWLSFYIILLPNTHQERFEIHPLTWVSLCFQTVCSVRQAQGTWFSDKPLKQFKHPPHVLFKIQPWLSCGFLKYASNYCHAWGAGKPPFWKARLQPESDSHAVPGVGVLSEPCVDYWEIVKII